MNFEIIFSLIVLFSGIFTLLDGAALYVKGSVLFSIFTFILGVAHLIWAGSMLIKRNVYRLIRVIAAHIIIIMEIADLFLRRSFNITSILIMLIYVITLIYIAYFYDLKSYKSNKPEGKNGLEKGNRFNLN